MPHREPPRAQVSLDQGRELEQPQTVGDAAPIAPDALGKLLLGPPELREQSLVGLGLFHRIQIFALDVFDERHFQCKLVWNVAHNGGDFIQAGALCRAPTTFAGD